MPSPPYLQLERNLANAHRFIRLAAGLADSMNSETVMLDLEQIAVEIERIQEALLRGMPRRRMTTDR